jgi:hypothetical protein
MFDIGFMCIAVIICMCDGLKVKLVDMAGRMHLYTRICPLWILFGNCKQRH